MSTLRAAFLKVLGPTAPLGLWTRTEAWLSTWGGSSVGGRSRCSRQRVQAWELERSLLWGLRPAPGRQPEAPSPAAGTDAEASPSRSPLLPCTSGGSGGAVLWVALQSPTESWSQSPTSSCSDCAPFPSTQLHCHHQHYFSVCKLRASLVVQRLKIHLPIQGTQVRCLIQDDPTG